MSNPRHSAAVRRGIKAVTKRINDAALVRRPLENYAKRSRGKKRARLADSDDDDSDFVNSSSNSEEDPDYVALRKRRKTNSTPLSPKNVEISSRASCGAKKPKSVRSKRKRGGDSILEPALSPSLEDQDLWGQRLPVDVLHKIYQFAVPNEPTVQFLTKMMKVCRNWNFAATSPHLWSTIDLEHLRERKPEIVFKGLEKYSTGIRSMSLSRWNTLRTPFLEELLQLTKELRVLNVSLCRALDMRRLLLVIIPQRCPKLISLDLSYYDAIGNKQVSRLVREFLSLDCGRQLEKLYLNGNALSTFQRFCSYFASNDLAKNLTVLHLSRVCSSSRVQCTVSVRDFVVAFPKLRELHMADALVFLECKNRNELESLVDPWPDLCDCNISTSDDFCNWDGRYDAFMKLLGRCKNLRQLNLSGLRMTSDRLLWLREIPLTNLNLSRVRGLVETTVEIDLFSTWVLSLEELSVSLVKNFVPYLCQFIVAVDSNGFSPRLKRLDLSQTDVNASQVKTLLDVCQSLEFVDLQSCRSMPLGMKDAYNGAAATALLRGKLNRYVESEENA